MILLNSITLNMNKIVNICCMMQTDGREFLPSRYGEQVSKNLQELFWFLTRVHKEWDK